MKNYGKLPAVIMTIGVCAAFSNIAVSSFILLNIFYNYTIPGNYIFGICTFVIVSLLQLIVNRGCVRISDVAAQYLLDSFPVKRLAIEAELNGGNITKEEADIKKNELQEKTDFLGLINDSLKMFSKIGKVITICSVCVLIVLLAIDILKIVTVDAKYIMAVIICGILSQLIMILTSLYVGRVIIRPER